MTEEPCSKREALPHCWHHSKDQHAAERHEDKFCCWCLTFRCFGVSEHTHGPFVSLVWASFERWMRVLQTRRPDA